MSVHSSTPLTVDDARDCGDGLQCGGGVEHWHVVHACTTYDSVGPHHVMILMHQVVTCSVNITYKTLNVSDEGLP